MQDKRNAFKTPWNTQVLHRSMTMDFEERGRYRWNEFTWLKTGTSGVALMYTAMHLWVP